MLNTIWSFVVANTLVDSIICYGTCPLFFSKSAKYGWVQFLKKSGLEDYIVKIQSE